MTSLADTIRRRTGAVDDAVVTDPDIAAALASFRMRHEALPIGWARTFDEDGARTYVRGHVPAWGVVEPAAHDDDPVTAIVTTRAGAAVAGAWSLEQDGTITFAATQSSGDVVVSLYSYDVNLACAEVVDQIAAAGGEYDVKLGDQTFYRSQGANSAGSLAARVAGFRAKALPVRTMLVRVDEEPSPIRRRGRR